MDATGPVPLKGDEPYHTLPLELCLCKRRKFSDVIDLDPFPGWRDHIVTGQ